ncbi:response regulator transcription factor [Paenibacillus pinistramenti]|uniref:response regulator transcription factor n=1 Tax=Paenibacillus pinistramenti TaxID=1768003 RepID=UPI001109DE43|nr:response regulator [Paenibacillus pinistramenti]
MNILIADDERAIREGIKRTILQAFPEHAVDVAETTAEAAELLGSKRFDLVLTDILMPGISGLEFMRMSKHRYPFVKWVVISAHNEFSYAQEAVRLGARDYLLKPIGKKRLAELIGELEEEIRQEKSLFREEELLKSNLKYLREGVFQRLASGLDTGNLSLEPFIEDYPRFHLILVQLDAGERNANLEHFIMENVLSELIDRCGGGFVVSYDRQSVLGLFKPASPAKLEQLQQQLKEHMNHYLRVPYQIRVSGESNDIRSVPQMISGMRKPSPVKLTEPAKGTGETAIDIALDYINEHYNEDLSLERVASVVFLNPVYFSQLFKQKTGQGYKEYVISLRLEHAKKLLQNPSFRLAEIAEQIGYQDMRHFTQVFRKKFGLTPTEYRMQQESTVK